jgi:hypothetical protein
LVDTRGRHANLDNSGQRIDNALHASFWRASARVGDKTTARLDISSEIQIPHGSILEARGKTELLMK